MDRTLVRFAAAAQMDMPGRRCVAEQSWIEAVGPAAATAQQFRQMLDFDEIVDDLQGRRFRR
ncbi:MULTISPECIES: hypothetical protein [Xanthomonas]|uniref:Uncharacterized protein n=1 Tax=Xanthomonas indica TaxID=2912242 RepID=A0AAU8I0C2_9XANT|nr:hypothetical protein [Xanthomonas indica]MCI2261775.1 hypothetical protein [Xanthomonas indica]